MFKVSPSAKKDVSEPETKCWWIYSNNKISAVRDFFSRFYLLFYKLLKIPKIVLAKKNWLLKASLLHSKNFFRTLNYMVINVFKKHKICPIHDFLSRPYLLFYKPLKLAKIFFVKELYKVDFWRHSPVLKKSFQELKLCGNYRPSKA